jgi:hypothetical protein
VNYVANPSAKLGQQWTCPVVPSPGQKVNAADATAPCQTRADLVPYNMYDDGNAYIRAGYFDWPTENLYQNGPSRGYNLDVRGGTQAIRYFLSANYDYEEGFVWFNHDEVFRLRGNVGVVFNDHFSLDVSTGYVDGYSRLENATPADGGIWQDLIWSNGYYLDRITPFGGAGNCSTGSPCDPSPRLGGFQEHLPIDVAENEGTRDYSRFTASGTLNFTSGELAIGNMTASLTQRAVVGIDRGVDVNRIMHPLEDGIVPESVRAYCANPDRVAQGLLANCASSWGSVYSETAAGELQYERPIQTNLSFDYALTANLDVTDALRFGTSFGAQYYVDQRDMFSAHGTGFASPQSTTPNQLAQASTAVDYSFVENRSLGFYVQEEINFADRIFVTGAVRFDDNSTFGSEAPAQKYPKVSATWVVSDESFWSFDVINSLRLRGAWGKAGRQPSAVAGINQYVVVPGAGGASAIRASAPGNPGVEPEVSTELELGFDIAVLDDRLSGEFTHYQRQNQQSLLGIGNLSSTGFPGSVDTNVGRIDNWGWEAQLSARLYESDLISFDLDLAADYTNNEIKDLCDDASGAEVCFSGTTSIRIGYPYPNRTTPDMVVDAGFDASLSQCNATLYAAGTRCRWGQNAFGRGFYAYCDTGVTTAPGGASDPNVLRYGLFPGGALEQCGNAVDKNVYVGRGFATHTFSVSPRITMLEGDLQVYALAEGQYGRVGDDSGHLWGHNYRNSAVSRVQDDAWWIAGDLSTGTGCNIHNCFFDQDFWKIREVGLRYNLPESIIGVTGAQRASLAFSARNPYTIWQAQKRISGHVVTDPEMGNPNQLTGGGNFYAQPPISTLSMTLRVTF